MNIKQICKFLSTAMLFLLSGGQQSWADLTVIGTAVYSGPSVSFYGTDFNLIYENDSIGGGVVWLDFTRANRTTWQNQMNWAADIGSFLTIELFDGYTSDIDWTTGWRLPSSGDAPKTGYDQTTSEFGHLFYVSLGNAGHSVSNPVNTGPFANLYTQPNGSGYWTETTYLASNGVTYSYGFLIAPGYQLTAGQSGELYAMAVHSGTVSYSAPVPVPAAGWLLGAGLLGLMGLRRKSH